MTSKVIQGHKDDLFILKSTFSSIYFVLFVLLNNEHKRERDRKKKIIAYQKLLI